MDRIPGWKRALDLSLVCLGLPLWLPLMVIVMVLIKVTSPGPVFFRQERVGYRGKRFMLFKFRSMRVSVETGSHERYFHNLIETDRPMTKLDLTGDPRLIPWGKILRASGLDELPQIFNVLRGEMSLVGPRPCTPQEFECYQSWHRGRVQAPPGLTGYWQVNGKNKTTFNEMVKMDISYGEHMSIGSDLAIIAKTIPTLFGQIFETWNGSRPARPETALAQPAPIPGKG